MYGAAAGAVLVAVAVPAGLAWRVWRHPTLVQGVLAGTVMSLFVVIPWSFMASLTIGPSGPAGPDGHSAGALRDWYVRLAAGPTGNPAELAVVVTTLVVAYCLLAAWRYGRPAGQAAADGQAGPAGEDTPGELAGWPAAGDDGQPGPDPAWPAPGMWY